MKPDMEKVFSGIIFDIYQWEQEMYDGSKTTFEKAFKKPVVGVLAITKEKKVLYLEQQQPTRNTYLSVPAGGVEEGETFEEAAKRELLEETGFVCDKLEPFFDFTGTSKVHQDEKYFIGRNAHKIQEQRPDSGEKITVHECSVEEFFQLIRRNDFLIRSQVKFMFYEALLEKEKKEILLHKILH